MGPGVFARGKAGGGMDWWQGDVVTFRPRASLRHTCVQRSGLLAIFRAI